MLLGTALKDKVSVAQPVTNAEAIARRIKRLGIERRCPSRSEERGSDFGGMHLEVTVVAVVETVFVLDSSSSGGILNDGLVTGIVKGEQRDGRAAVGADDGDGGLLSVGDILDENERQRLRCSGLEVYLVLWARVIARFAQPIG